MLIRIVNRFPLHVRTTFIAVKSLLCINKFRTPRNARINSNIYLYWWMYVTCVYMRSHTVQCSPFSFPFPHTLAVSLFIYLLIYTPTGSVNLPWQLLWGTWDECPLNINKTRSEHEPDTLWTWTRHALNMNQTRSEYEPNTFWTWTKQALTVKLTGSEYE